MAHFGGGRPGAPGGARGRPGRPGAPRPGPGNFPEISAPPGAPILGGSGGCPGSPCPGVIRRDPLGAIITPQPTMRFATLSRNASVFHPKHSVTCRDVARACHAFVWVCCIPQYLFALRANRLRGVAAERQLRRGPLEPRRQSAPIVSNGWHQPASTSLDTQAHHRLRHPSGTGEISPVGSNRRQT